MNYQIEPLQSEDWWQVRSIYEESISTGVSTFDTKPPNWKDWDSSRLPSCRLVARYGKYIYGWASLSPASST
jgi:phosphinothricin acetyltransferase